MDYSLDNDTLTLVYFGGATQDLRDVVQEGTACDETGDLYIDYCILQSTEENVPLDSVTLIYQDTDGSLLAQPAEDLVDSGTLVSAYDDEDLPMVGFRID